MNELILLASAAPESGNVVQEISRTFGLNTAHFLAQAISFSIVAFCLHRFAYRPILRVLEERRQRIAESLANADRIKEELARTEEARKEVMAKAGQEADRLIKEAREAVARIQEQESQKAIQQAEQIVAKAREAAEADHARMMSELRGEVGRLVVETTARVANKVLTDADQRRLVEEANRELVA